MPKFRKKPVIIEAQQWDKSKPHDKVVLVSQSPINFLRNDKCFHCGGIMGDHGYIGTFEGEHIVCPGDWVIKGVADEFYACKPYIFEKTYELIQE